MEGALPVSVSYSVEVEPARSTVDFRGTFRLGLRPLRSLTLARGHADEWLTTLDDAAPTTDAPLAGACCIDLGWTPLTNTFAIWHLDLPIGGGGEIVAAWVPFPDLTPAPAAQRYTRTGERRYRYEQAAIDFSADIEVDADGFALRYGDIWERVPVSR